MFILSIVFTFVLSYTLTLLWHKVRQARNENVDFSPNNPNMGYWFSHILRGY